MSEKHESVDMDAYLESARQLFETGKDGGRAGVIQYLRASVALIRTTDSDNRRSVVPLYVLIHALQGLDSNIVHPILIPAPSQGGRPKASNLRNFTKAWSVCIADWLHELGFRRSEADNEVAKALNGKMSPEHAEDRITGQTIRNWRSLINRTSKEEYLRSIYESLLLNRPDYAFAKPRERAKSDLLNALDQVLCGLRPSDL